MPSKEDQPSLLARIRALSERIQEYRYRFSLPRGHKDRYETHGAASGLQRLKQERSTLQGKLDPIRLIASGISCRDCLHFVGGNQRLCWHDQRWPKATDEARADDSYCGPTAQAFEPIAAHA